MKIIGLRPYKMTAQDTGELIEGVTVHCTFEDDEIYGGVGVERFSISKEKLGDIGLEIGMEIRVGYNKYKRVDFIQVLSNARAY